MRVVMTETGWQIQIDVPDDASPEEMVSLLKLFDGDSREDGFDLFFEREEAELLDAYYDGFLSDEDEKKLFKGPWADMRRRRRVAAMKATGRTCS